MAKRESPEEKVLDKISRLINDLTLDLEQLGIYFGRTNGTTYRRLMTIAESAKYEKEDKDDYKY
jgi:myo-inositol-hexaphosphate 3-phosphohydrolase